MLPPARIPRRLALLVALLAGVPAAQAQLPKPPPESPAASQPGPACSVEQRRLVTVALAEAAPRLREAIAFLDRQPDHPHVQRYFGTAPRRQVRDRLTRTAAQIAQGLGGLKLACNDAPQCGAASFAYTVASVRLLGLCPGFFRAGTAGTDTRWGILIHEASHLAGVTGDHAYGVNGALRLAKQNPRRAAANADNLEYFVETLPRTAATHL